MASRMRRQIWLAVVASALVVSGCVSSRTTDTARTAVEQLLLSTAADRATLGILVMGLQDRKAFLDVSNMEATDKGYVAVAVRNALLQCGVPLLADAKESEVTVELGAGALAIDRSDFLIGIPSFDIPVPGAGLIQNPEIAVFKKISQTGRAKLLLSARQTQDGKPLLVSGPHFAAAYYNRWQLLFISWRTTDIPGL